MVFWDVMLCNVVGYQCFGGLCCLCLQGVVVGARNWILMQEQGVGMVDIHVSQEEGGRNLLVKAPLDGRGRKCMTLLQDECGGRTWEGSVCGTFKSRGSKPLFFSEGLLSFLWGLNERSP
jgi:hypothetical protein